MFNVLSHRRPRSMRRAPGLTDKQLASTIRAMAYNYRTLDPYRAAVLEEAAVRLTKVDNR